MSSQIEQNRLVRVNGQGMITIRGDLDAAFMKTALSEDFGFEVPKRGAIVHQKEHALSWMSPDELLLFVPYDEVKVAVNTLSSRFEGAFALAHDISDARTVFDIEGPDIRDALAKLTPANMAPDAIMPGVMRRSRLSQVPAAFWMIDEKRIRIICFRSVAHYVENILALSLRTEGAVGYFS